MTKEQVQAVISELESRLETNTKTIKELQEQNDGIIKDIISTIRNSDWHKQGLNEFYANLSNSFK